MNMQFMLLTASILKFDETHIFQDNTTEAIDGARVFLMFLQEACNKHLISKIKQ